MIQLLTTDWAQAWTITGLGVGMVAAILALLVVILTIFNMLSAKAEAKAKTAAGKTDAIQAAKRQTGEAATLSEVMGHDEVAIATALYMYFNDMHDNESGVITIDHNHENSGWHFQLGN